MTDKSPTGRLSPSEPNPQNIPVRTEEGRKVREALLGSYPPKNPFVCPGGSMNHKDVKSYCSPRTIVAWEERWTECAICGAVAWEDRGAVCVKDRPKKVLSFLARFLLRFLKS